MFGERKPLQIQGKRCRGAYLLCTHYQEWLEIQWLWTWTGRGCASVTFKDGF